MAIRCVRKAKSDVEKLSKRERVNALKVAVASHFSKNNFAPFFEVELDTTSRIRADVICINYSFKVAIIEIKSSIEDFESDDKWEKYLPFCNWLYFAADRKTIEHIREKVEPNHPNVGFLTIDSCEGITPFTLQTVKPASTLTSASYIDHKFLFRFMRSGCLFFQGVHVGMNKINAAVIDERWNHARKAEGKE